MSFGRRRPDGTPRAICSYTVFKCFILYLCLFLYLNKYLNIHQMSASVYFHSGLYIFQEKWNRFLLNLHYLCSLLVDGPLFLSLSSLPACCCLPCDVACVPAGSAEKGNRFVGLFTAHTHTQTCSPPKSFWGTGCQLGIVPVSEDLG